MKQAILLGLIIIPWEIPVFVAMASLIQLTALGFMMLSFFLIDIAFS